MSPTTVCIGTWFVVCTREVWPDSIQPCKVIETKDWQSTNCTCQRWNPNRALSQQEEDELGGNQRETWNRSQTSASQWIWERQSGDTQSNIMVTNYCRLDTGICQARKEYKTNQSREVHCPHWWAYTPNKMAETMLYTKKSMYKNFDIKLEMWTCCHTLL